jgi:hypothetical protein
MARYGETYRCPECSGDVVAGKTGDEAYDRYGIYCGVFHEACWRRSHYSRWEFDPAYAGERIDDDD